MAFDQSLGDIFYRRTKNVLRRGVLAASLMACPHGPASAVEIWFGPPDSISQFRKDFENLFADPSGWDAAARGVNVFSVGANYLVRAPVETIHKLLIFLDARQIKINVFISGWASDKKLCGDGVEGVVWPGEIELYAERLKARAINVDSFTLDTPLESGYFYRGVNACSFTVLETAKRTAATVHALRAVFPQAKIIDADVPTGRPISEWRAILEEWLQDFTDINGEPFYGFTMDVWWEFQWRQSIETTVTVLRKHGIRAGVFLDSDGRSDESAAEWIAEANRNACAVMRSGLPIDYFFIANWSGRAVNNLPLADPRTLTAFLASVEKPMNCYH